MAMSTAEAERQVENSRGELDRTMEAIRGKMTPGELFREAKTAMGGAGDQLVAKLIDQAKENPMPFAVMGLGLAWLATSSKERPSTRGGFNGPDFNPAGQGGLFDQAHDAATGAAGRLSGKAQEVAEQAGQSMAQAKDAVSNSAQMVMGQTRDRLTAVGASAGRTAQDLSRRTRDVAADLFDREPLLVGAVGLFVGLALGAAPPATAVEKKILAPVGSKIAGSAKEAAQGGLEEVRGAATAVYGAVKDELKNGDGSDGLAERAERTAKTAVGAARDRTQH